jgi:hypothetical protein
VVGSQDNTHKYKPRGFYLNDAAHKVKHWVLSIWHLKYWVMLLVSGKLIYDYLKTSKNKLSEWGYEGV